MSTDTILLVITIFLISVVEVIEMVTIVVAVGLQRGWFATLTGGGVGLVLLAATVAVFGSLLGNLPLDALQAVIGILLLLFGLQWLRKSIYRISLNGFWSGEEEEDENTDNKNQNQQGFDWIAFGRGFQGVFFEGLEVAFVVISFGAANNKLGLGSIAAGLAFVVVVGVAIFALDWLTSIPDTSFKFMAGILLTTYGTFWATSGMGATFPGEDWGVIGVLAIVILASIGAVYLTRKLRQTTPQGGTS